MTDSCWFCHQCKGALFPQLPESIGAKRPFKCPKCSRDIILINLATARDCVQRSRRTIYDWIETGRISTLRVAGGSRLIVYSSLFLPDDAPGQGQR